MQDKIVYEIPKDYEAEQAVLGAIIYDNDCHKIIDGILEPTDFYTPAHQYIYRAILELINSQQPLDELLLGDRLKTLNQLEKVGGYTYLTSLLDCVPSSGNIEHYATLIKKHAELRKLIAAAEDIAQKSYGPGRHILELKSELEEKLSVIGVNLKDRTEYLREIFPEFFENLERISQHKNSIPGVSTGFVDLDRVTNGFKPGQLVIVAARPSVGKTAFALNMAKHMAFVQNPDERKPIPIFSLEMEKKELLERLISSEARIPLDIVSSGRLDKNQWDGLSLAIGRLSAVLIKINDTAIHINEIKAIATRIYNRSESGIGPIFVDYLQIVQGTKEYREQEIAELSRELKRLAKKLGTTIIALSQLNRNLENRTDRRPRLSDLRESGSLEQDADVVLFIYRDEVYNDETPEPGIAEINIAKQRNGPIGCIKLSFQGQYTLFSNYSGR